jgi:hypothetical protein
MNTTHPPETYTNVLAEADVDGGWSGQLRVVRATGINGQELVFVDSDLLGASRLILTPQEAVDFAEGAQNASGMASSTYGAQFLAESVRGGLARKGLSRNKVQEPTGISRRRLSQILAGTVPMTRAELTAISEVEA